MILIVIASKYYDTYFLKSIQFWFDLTINLCLTIFYHSVALNIEIHILRHLSMDLFV